MKKGFSLAADQKRMKKKVTRDWAAGFPADLLANIFSRLETADLLRSAQWVCKCWRNASKIPFAFQSIRLKSCYPSDRSSDSRVCGLFAEAARRSNGHLTEIDISSRYFSDKLLKLVTSSATRVRRLRLHGCGDNITDTGLIESAPNLPLLEDLEIYDCYFVSKRSVEAIGNCCPLLRVFKFPMVGGTTETGNDEAHAIARTMPGLQHLVMPGNSTTEGVDAVLKGCPDLEHLDLSGCYKVFPDKESVSRWRKRVRNLVLREDAEEDHDYDYDFEFDFFDDGGDYDEFGAYEYY